MNTSASDIELLNDKSPLRVQKKCARCKNHGIMNPMRGHKRYCTFRYCKCNDCKQTEKRQKIMARKIAICRAKEFEIAHGQAKDSQSQPICKQYNQSSSQLVQRQITSESSQFSSSESLLLMHSKSHQNVYNSQYFLQPNSFIENQYNQNVDNSNETELNGSLIQNDITIPSKLDLISPKFSTRIRSSSKLKFRMPGECHNMSGEKLF